MKTSSPVGRSHIGSPHLDQTDVEAHSDSGHSTPSPAKVAVPSGSQAPPRGQKRKSIADTLAETVAAKRKARAQLYTMAAREKTQRAAERERIKRSSTEKIELARLDHQRTEASAQRMHEERMLDKQIELERLRAVSHPPFEGHRRMTNTYPGPAPGSWLDPSLGP
jgi:hypothetical protein